MHQLSQQNSLRLRLKPQISLLWRALAHDITRILQSDSLASSNGSSTLYIARYQYVSLILQVINTDTRCKTKINIDCRRYMQYLMFREGALVLRRRVARRRSQQEVGLAAPSLPVVSKPLPSPSQQAVLPIHTRIGLNQ